MAARKTNNQKSNDFLEFSMKGKTFNYSGRIYPDRKREAGKLTIYPISLTLNDAITIKFCSFYQTKDNMWVGGPQYKTGDEYKDYLYIDKSVNEEKAHIARANGKVPFQNIKASLCAKHFSQNLKIFRVIGVKGLFGVGHFHSPIAF